MVQAELYIRLTVVCKSALLQNKVRLISEKQWLVYS